MIKSLFILFLTFFINQQANTIRYHELAFSSSDPIITKRCICISPNNKQGGFVKETYDENGRCHMLEFFRKKGVYFESIDFPSIIKYSWTDTSLIEKLYDSSGEIFSKDYLVRPNKKEYVLDNMTVIKIVSFFNDEVISVQNVKNMELEEADFFMMYSGCQVKENNKNKMKF